MVDALELFAGLITFADSKAEDKLRCKKKSAYKCSPVRLVRLQRNSKLEFDGPRIRNPVRAYLNKQDL